jgi:hypothetical protein
MALFQGQHEGPTEDELCGLHCIWAGGSSEDGYIGLAKDDGCKCTSESGQIVLLSNGMHEVLVRIQGGHLLSVFCQPPKPPQSESPSTQEQYVGLQMMCK